MLLSEPFFISSRLRPAIKIDDCTISMHYDDKQLDGRDVFRYYLDFPDESLDYSANDIKSGCQGCSLQSAFATLLSFMSTCGEAMQYVMRTGRETENDDLFPPHIALWCEQHTDELSMLSMELEETPNLIS